MIQYVQGNCEARRDSIPLENPERNVGHRQFSAYPGPVSTIKGIVRMPDRDGQCQQYVDVLDGGTEIGTENILFRNAVTVEIWVEIPDIYSVSESCQENAAPIDLLATPGHRVSHIWK